MTKEAPIQVLKPFFRTQETLDAIKQCLDVGWTGMGFKTVEFENLWKEYTGLNNAVFQNSATASLHSAIAILKYQFKWNDNDEILTTPLTFVSTNHAVLYERLKPVFVDVDESLTIDPNDLIKKVSSRTRAVIFVAMGGNLGNLLKVKEICEQNNLKLILDAAHASGSKVENQDLGSFSDVACYSFQAVKNLPTADSGMVCFKEEELSAKASKFSWLGINKDTYSRAQQGTYLWDYEVDYVGYKYNGNSIMAAIGIVALKYLDEDNAQRRKFFLKYEELLSNNPYVKLIKHVNSQSTSQHLIQIVCDNRDELINFMSERNIFLGVHYRDNRDYRLYSEPNDTCCNASRISKQLVSLPNHLWLTMNDVSRIAKTINEFFKVS